MSAKPDVKLLIFVVAYNAEKKIADVLGRIPIDELPAATDVLIIDDCSTDQTFATSLEYLSAGTPLNLTVLRNPANQGYGGNQKIGYQYACDHGYDIVALLHGDGQYAPERLPELIRPVAEDEADACFGTRMMPRGAALQDGMPLYKYVGNRILTTLQNAILGMDLSEFHSGYRVYSVAALRQLPFHYNTGDFHFDTEIIIQCRLRGLRIAERPIPTYYGDEICHVNGLAYAWNVLRETVASRLHGMGVFYRRQYDVDEANEHYDLKLGYPSSHTMAIEAVGENADVLDLGCGQALVAREFAARGCRVTGVDRFPVPEGSVTAFHCHDLNAPDLPADLGTYDAIVALDIIEHLNSPERLLETLRTTCYDERTKVVVTVPNIGFVMTRLALLFGQFNYGRAGILDLTHQRLFTIASLRRLLHQEGYPVVRMRGIPAPFPKALGDNVFSRLLVRINQGLIAILPGLFSYQIYAEARMLPPVPRLLRRTLEASRAATSQ